MKKILLGGAGGVGKTTLLNRFLSNRWIPSPMTIGIQFSSKVVEVEGMTERLIFFDFAGQRRWRFFQESFFSGADGAILSFDFQRYISFENLEEWVQLFRINNPNLPILLIGTKADYEDRVVSKNNIKEFMEKYDIFNFIEVSSLTGENVKIIFENLIRKILGLELLSVPEIPGRMTSGRPRRNNKNSISNYAIKKYQINEYISLQLDWNMTNIYINGIHFNQCKYLLLDIPLSEIEKYDEIDSIDKAVELLDHSLETHSIERFKIDPETEFWGHCSNLQAWVENDYDTRIIHRNLAFPLLKKLSEIGDLIAKKVFKNEIALRLEENFSSVTHYLVEEGYLKFFNKEELDLLCKKNDLLKKLIKNRVLH
ncbi:MAG: Rab family GTPase [Promethearchaeota archaeon]